MKLQNPFFNTENLSCLSVKPIGYSYDPYVKQGGVVPVT